MKRRALLGSALCASLAAGVAPAFAQTYPDRPVRIVVPYAPGGTTDLLARIVATRLGAILKQPFVIDNRPGAGGAVGSAYAAKQPADGYTLVMVVESSHAVNPNVYAKRAYDPVEDFAPIGNIADVPNVLVANPAFPASDLAGFLEELKRQPARYAFGSSGNGGLSHINGELFKRVTGTDLLHVPYKGLGPALTDLVAGQINVVFDNIPSSAALIQAGQIRPLAVAARSRLKLLPDVPTYAEAGLPAMNHPSWFGLGAPAGTPPGVLDRVSAALRETLADPEVVAAIEKQGAVPSPMARADFARLVATKNVRWAKVVADIAFEKL